MRNYFGNVKPYTIKTVKMEMNFNVSFFKREILSHIPISVEHSCDDR